MCAKQLISSLNSNYNLWLYLNQFLFQALVCQIRSLADIDEFKDKQVDLGLCFGHSLEQTTVTFLKYCNFDIKMCWPMRISLSRLAVKPWLRSYDLNIKREHILSRDSLKFVSV